MFKKIINRAKKYNLRDLIEQLNIAGVINTNTASQEVFASYSVKNLQNRVKYLEKHLSGLLNHLKIKPKSSMIFNELPEGETNHLSYFEDDEQLPF
jgi:hypothetical protein